MKTVIVVDDVFEEDYLKKLDKLCEGELKQLDSDTGSHVGDYSEYEWQIVKNDIRKSYDRLEFCLLYTSDAADE